MAESEKSTVEKSAEKGSPAAPKGRKVKLRHMTKRGSYRHIKAGIKFSDTDGQVQEVDADFAKYLLALKHHTYDDNGHVTTIQRFERIEETA